MNDIFRPNVPALTPVSRDLEKRAEEETARFSARIAADAYVSVMAAAFCGCRWRAAFLPWLPTWHLGSCPFARR